MEGSGVSTEFHKPGRHSDIYAIRFGGFRHDRSRADHASLRDFHSVGDGDPRSEPDVITDLHPFSSETLLSDELVPAIKNVIGRHDDGVSGDADIRADLESSVAVEDTAGVDGTMVADTDETAISEELNATVDFTPVADLDASFSPLKNGTGVDDRPFAYKAPGSERLET